MRRERRSLRGGFTMMEMMIALGLLSAFAVIGGRIFTTSMRTVYASRQAETALLRFDHALEQLRRDVWNAQQTRVESNRQLALNDGQITWQIQADGSLERREKHSAMTWRDLPRGYSFQADGPLLVVKTAASEFRLANLMAMNQEARP